MFFSISSCSLFLVSCFVFLMLRRHPISTLFPYTTLFRSKKTKVIFVTSFVGALVNVIVNLILIKYIGLYAVVISSFIAFLVVWLIRVFASKRYFKITIDYKDMVILLSLIAIANFVPFIFGPIELFICICLGGVVFISYNLKLIKLISSRLRSIFRRSVE